MIGDTLRARCLDPEYRRILDKIEWVQVPYPVFPYLPDEDCLDWHEDRVPEHLIPRDHEHVGALRVDRMPFQSTGLFFPGEGGAVLSIEQYGKTDDEVRAIAHKVLNSGIPDIDVRGWHVGHVDGALIAYLIGILPSFYPGLVLQTFCYLIVRADPRESRSDPYAARFLWPIMSALMDTDAPERLVQDGLRLIHAINTAGTLRVNGEPATPAIFADAGRWAEYVAARGGTVQTMREQWWLDTGHMALTISTASALLNARNLKKEIVTPPHIRAARRRGDPPPYRYHVLKIDAARARARAHSEGDGDALALHLRRGHWKVFTPSAPLLGKHVGRWWWAAHLAGQADRVVEKDYRVDGPAS
jgi:hypothetical protein